MTGTDASEMNRGSGREAFTWPVTGCGAAPRNLEIVQPGREVNVLQLADCTPCDIHWESPRLAPDRQLASPSISERLDHAMNGSLSCDACQRDWAPRPISLYGVSKLFGEGLARYFVETSRMSFIGLRISGINAANKPSPGRDISIWCSHRDMAQMAVKCIEAPPSVQFDIFYVTSNNAFRFQDLEHARRVVGFEPQDAA